MAIEQQEISPRPISIEDIDAKLAQMRESAEFGIISKKELTLAENASNLLRIPAPPSIFRLEGIKMAEPQRQSQIETRTLILSDEDIEQIANPPDVRRLEETDIRVLAALIRTDNKHAILVEDLAKKINPKKSTGFAMEIASLPRRIDYYNSVVLPGTRMQIKRLNFVYEDDPGGYYITRHVDDYPGSPTLDYNFDAETNLRIRLLKEAVNRVEKAQDIKTHQDCKIVSSSLGNNTTVAVAIKRGKELTKPIILRDSVIDDVEVPEYARTDEEGKILKPPIYVLKASTMLELFSVLFQSGPVPIRIVKSSLSDDFGPISQRELQLYIDILNNCVSSKIIAYAKERGRPILLSGSIVEFGLCIKLYDAAKGENEAIMLSKYDPNSPGKVLPGQYKTINDELKTMDQRQRRRHPTHGRLKL